MNNKINSMIPHESTQEISQFLTHLRRQIILNVGEENREAQNAFNAVEKSVEAMGIIPHFGCLVVTNAQSGEKRIIFFDSSLDNDLTMDEKRILASVMLPTGTSSDETVPSTDPAPPITNDKNGRHLITVSRDIPVSIDDVAPPMQHLLLEAWAVIREIAAADPSGKDISTGLFREIYLVVRKLDRGFRKIASQEHPPPFHEFISNGKKLQMPRANRRGLRELYVIYSASPGEMMFPEE